MCLKFKCNPSIGRNFVLSEIKLFYLHETGLRLHFKTPWIVFLVYFLSSWAEWDSHVWQCGPLSTDQQGSNSRVLSQRACKRLARKRLQTPSLGELWTAKGTGRACVDAKSAQMKEQFVSLWTTPSNDTNNFETLLREGSKRLHKVQRQFTARGTVLGPRLLFKRVWRFVSLKRKTMVLHPWNRTPLFTFLLANEWEKAEVNGCVHTESPLNVKCSVSLV